MGIEGIKLGPKSRALGQRCSCLKYFTPSALVPFVAPDGVHHYVDRPCAPGTPERAGRAGDQELPAVGTESVFASVRGWIDEREAKGVQRYGRSLEAFNGRDAHRDAREEALDLLVYLEQSRIEHDAVVRALLVLAEYARNPSGVRSLAAVNVACELAAKLDPRSKP